MRDTEPTAPGVPIIGYLKSGRPVYQIAGGDGTGDGQSGTGQGDGAADGSQAGQEGAAGGQEGSGAPPDTSSGQDGAEGQQDSDGAAGQQDGEGDISKLPAFAQKIIRELRGEAAGHRTKARDAEGKVSEAEAKHQATLDAIAKAVGLKPDDGPPDPAKLASQLQQSQTEIQAAREEAASARIELQVYRAAVEAGANAKKLMDSRAFEARIDALDPKDDAEFASLVEAEITAALEKDPTLRANQPQPKPPKPRSGGDIPGGPGGSGPITEDQLAKMSPDEIAKAYADGRLKHLM
jgi:hypothetical protein